MPKLCAVRNCGSRGGRDSKGLFSLPKASLRHNEEKREMTSRRRELWLKALQRESVPEAKLNYLYVCEDHFASGKPAVLSDIESVDWVPSLKLVIQPRSPRTNQRRLEEAALLREEAARRRERKLAGKMIRQQLAQQQIIERDVRHQERLAAREEKVRTKQLRKAEKELRRREREAVAAERENQNRLKAAAVEMELAELDRSHEEERRLEQQSQRVAQQLVAAAVNDSCNGDSVSELVSSIQDFDDLLGMKYVAVQTSIDLRGMNDILSAPSKLKVLGLKWLDSDAKTLFYTGLPSLALVEHVFNLAEPYLEATPTIGKSQSFLMTLMIMRLNLSFTDMGYRIGVHRTTIARHFNHCVSVLYIRLKNVIVWPKRHVLRETMPKSFRETFGDKVTVIIDCFEIFCQKPSNLLAGAEEYSSYKKHHTNKVLIGITPQGTISYISGAWVGRTSDKYLTENCGFLKKLKPGDLVMADRGFLIHESVGMYCAEVVIPAFTRGKAQLSALDVESTRAIAHVRIHVERVTGSLRQKYKILSGIMPVISQKRKHSEIHQINEIITVCALLINLCPPIVPLE